MAQQCGKRKAASPGDAEGRFWVRILRNWRESVREGEQAIDWNWRFWIARKNQIITATSGPSPLEYVLAMILKIVGMGAEIGAGWYSQFPIGIYQPFYRVGHLFPSLEDREILID